MLSTREVRKAVEAEIPEDDQSGGLSRIKHASIRDEGRRRADDLGKARPRISLPVVSFDEQDPERPQTRKDCLPGGVNEQRPCPWVACKFHLYLDVRPSGAIRLAFPDLEPWDLESSCALDVAERGGVTLEEVGELTNLTRERIRQLEVRGLLQGKASGLISREDAVNLGRESSE